MTCVPQTCGSKDATLYSNRALCHLKLGQWREAIEDCQYAIQIDSSLVKGHFFMGQALVEIGKFDDALICLKTGQWHTVLNRNYISRINF